MASVTIKDVSETDLAALAGRAELEGMSVQELMRRLIAREAARPILADELAALVRRHQADRKPMTMAEFNKARRTALRG